MLGKIEKVDFSPIYNPPPPKIRPFNSDPLLHALLVKLTVPLNISALFSLEKIAPPQLYAMLLMNLLVPVKLTVAADVEIAPPQLAELLMK